MSKPAWLCRTVQLNINDTRVKSLVTSNSRNLFLNGVLYTRFHKFSNLLLQGLRRLILKLINDSPYPTLCLSTRLAFETDPMLLLLLDEFVIQNQATLLPTKIQVGGRGVIQTF